MKSERISILQWMHFILFQLVFVVALCAWKVVFAHCIIKIWLVYKGYLVRFWFVVMVKHFYGFLRRQRIWNLNFTGYNWYWINFSVCRLWKIHLLCETIGFYGSCYFCHITHFILLKRYRLRLLDTVLLPYHSNPLILHQLNRLCFPMCLLGQINLIYI